MNIQQKILISDNGSNSTSYRTEPQEVDIRSEGERQHNE